MSKKSPSPRVFSREFKLEAVRRFLAGERVRALSQELKVWPQKLYEWRAAFRGGGAPALRPMGRPRKANSAAAGDGSEQGHGVAGPGLDPPGRIAALERKIGQQQVELDFFRLALRQVEATRRPSAGRGVRGSTRSSKR
jgi:transposase